MSDSELLQRFVTHGDQSAFTELARRHVTLVYAAASRTLNGDSPAAEDVAQQVFIDLARKAPKLLGHASLAGWLYACARFNAINTIRAEQRRAHREKEADMVAPTSPTIDGNQLQNVLDPALDELSDRDRQLVLLRFFGQQSFAAIAHQFRLSENAAQKAVSRALDVLNGSLAKRGITSTAAALEAALAHAAVSAPSTLVVKITSSALSGTAGGVIIKTGVAGALKLALTMGAAAGLAMTVGYWTGRERELNAAAREAAERDRDVTAQVQRMNDRLRDQTRRLAIADADTASLLRAIDDARRGREAARRTAGVFAVAPATTAVTTAPTAYVVRAGDTFARIARTYRLDVAALVAANPNYDYRRMRIGQVITLPPGAAVVDASDTASAGR